MIVPHGSVRAAAPGRGGDIAPSLGLVRAHLDLLDDQLDEIDPEQVRLLRSHSEWAYAAVTVRLLDAQPDRAATLTGADIAVEHAITDNPEILEDPVLTRRARTLLELIPELGLDGPLTAITDRAGVAGIDAVWHWLDTTALDTAAGIVSLDQARARKRSG
jgi:hypothetical protein